ncbi:uncharacterized protein BDW43DRAFT_292825 [Aspergillus alliaceus]|uniref:uncharacterized protein n=1 Tax=Petromyces alliaceus TaxID=209559 RepID=UPI0012A3EC14|nr:uncharacterized protein BDW43DRAFT_292825 [Aspergillus alliaceus]KAB8227919.1 hypothetical protein BDW43DRAFT_292825 [Aspergillus alliaceus]
MKPVVIKPSFEIQHAAAGRYQLGTIERCFHLPIETLLSSREGAIALLQYGEILRTIPSLWRLPRRCENWTLRHEMHISLEGDRAIVVYGFNRINMPAEALRNSYVGRILLNSNNGIWVTLAQALCAGVRKNCRRIVTRMTWRIRRFL